MGTPILTFFTAIVFMVQSFSKYMIQRVHKLCNHCRKAASVKEVEEDESDYCSVCLSQICRGEKIKSLPVCNHRYHAECIGAWLKNHSTCPLCRNKINDHSTHNQHKQVKNLRESFLNLMQSFSDILVALLYLVLPSSITESFPLIDGGSWTPFQIGDDGDGFQHLRMARLQICGRGSYDRWEGIAVFLPTALDRSKRGPFPLNGARCRLRQRNGADPQHQTQGRSR
ncbi:hypothetical protein RJT34_17432 [Clitoria ternatea]|uniref:RING-type E3 ubiquitin transferase n=1 Tax=Clitoria ternatea TaxID=43366 RepID=A0AAN9PD94_CLITE